MKNKARSEITRERLETLVSEWFEGRLSEQEEELLRQVLAVTPIRSAAIEEARAVMGVFAAQRASRRKRSTTLWVKPMRYAAAVAAAVICAGSIAMVMSRGDDRGDGLVAYCGGEKIDNPEMVLQIMSSDLQSLGEASAEIDAALSELDVLSGNNALNYITS